MSAQVDLPSLVSRVAHFTSAFGNHLHDGFRKCSHDEITARLRICSACEFFSGTHCLKCGCNCSGNNSFFNKLAWKSETCPLNRWTDNERRRMPPQSAMPAKQYSNLAGLYYYRRVFYDERPLELLPNGEIGIGAENGERQWMVIEEHGREYIVLTGEYGPLCRLARSSDGVWRGRWDHFERMAIDLYPPGMAVPDLPRYVKDFDTASTGFAFISYQEFLRDIYALLEKLPPIRGVVGNPRSGLLPAAVIALARNVPVLDMDDLLERRQPLVLSCRRRSINDLDETLPILVVDDTVASGRQYAYLRMRLRERHHLLWASVYAYQHPTSLALVDYFGRELPNCPQTYEWTVLHDHNTPHILSDLDGVLCEEWTSDEDQDPLAYLNHLSYAKPLRIPTQPLLAIVTGRLEKYRSVTTHWLERHGIKYGQLHMMPASTTSERNRIGHAEFKASVYGSYPQALAFVESCSVQSARIQEMTGRPVISFSAMQLHSANKAVATEPRPVTDAGRIQSTPSSPHVLGRTHLRSWAYDLSPYRDAWDWPEWSIDPRHLFWMYDVLATGLFRSALEIGSLHGASSSAFVEALNRDFLKVAVFCDVKPRPNLERVLHRLLDPSRGLIFPGRSVDALRKAGPFDFVFVDGDHSLAAVREEVELLLDREIDTIFAHDTSAQTLGYQNMDGPAYLKQRFQSTPGYFCLEDNAMRPGELTHRGLFFATRRMDVFLNAQQALLKWGAITSTTRNDQNR